MSTQSPLHFLNRGSLHGTHTGEFLSSPGFSVPKLSGHTQIPALLRTEPFLHLGTHLFAPSIVIISCVDSSHGPHLPSCSGASGGHTQNPLSSRTRFSPGYCVLHFSRQFPFTSSCVASGHPHSHVSLFTTISLPQLHALHGLAAVGAAVSPAFSFGQQNPFTILFVPAHSTHSPVAGSRACAGPRSTSGHLSTQYVTPSTTLGI